MMLAVQFADFGFGTVVGAVVAGSIAIFLDQRRRNDERRNRFLAEKRLVYRSVAQVLDVIDEQIHLARIWQSYFERLEELDDEDRKLLKEAGAALKRSVASAKEEYFDDRTDFALLGSSAARRAMSNALEIARQMILCLATGDLEKIDRLEVEYRDATRNFRYIDREDLGIDA